MLSIFVQILNMIFFLFILECPSRKSLIVKKNEKRNGVQQYRCIICFLQFNVRKQISPQEV